MSKVYTNNRNTMAPGSACGLVTFSLGEMTLTFSSSRTTPAQESKMVSSHVGFTNFPVPPSTRPYMAGANDPCWPGLRAVQGSGTTRFDATPRPTGINSVQLGPTL